MNGFFLFNATMLAICTYNVARIPYRAPVWAQAIVYGGFVFVGVATALSFGDGPLSGSN